MVFRRVVSSYSYRLANLPPMRLQFGIAVLLAFIASLSSFMIGLGSSTHFTTVLVFIAAVTSLYFTDLKRTIELNRFVSNFLILLIVFLSVGNLFRDRSVDLAIGIARLLQLIQIVVLFQEKNSRNRWHILLISFLQVVVATAFQLHIAYGFLLLVYVFANLCAFTLIFLFEENTYYKKHSFARKGKHIRKELRQRQNWTRLIKIAFATMVVGPLSLILFYRESEEEEDEHKARDAARENVPRDAKFHEYREKRRKKVAAAKKNWSARNLWKLFREGFTPSSKTKKKRETENAARNTSLSGFFVPVSVAQSGTKNYRYDVNNDSTHWEPVEEDGGNLEENRDESPVGFDPGRHLEPLKDAAEPLAPRWPLLRYRPIFSGGTNRSANTVNGRYELYMRLFKGTILSLLLGIPIFLLTPRFGGTEVLGQRFSYQQWRSAPPPMVSSVGFTEDIRLGSLGNVLQNYQEVLTVDFRTPGVNYRNAVGMSRAEFLEKTERPYHEIDGEAFYLRGVVAERYEFGKGRWFRSAPPPPPPPGFGPFPDYFASHEERLLDQDDLSESFFDETNDMVRMKTITQRLNSPVLFTTWPYLFSSQEAIRVRVHNDRIEFAGDRRVGRDGFHQSYYTNAFRRGVQTDLTPVREEINIFSMLECEDKDVPELVALARKWNDESGLDENDFIARARFLEKKLRTDERFSYQLGGITREYGVDPLEDFVTNNPKGHCEYFAGTLAVMLRAVGIPSRVCIGYKVLADNRGNRGYLVRQSDAHSWVEAFIPYEQLPREYRSEKLLHHWHRGGLLRLDATPSSEETMFKGFSMSLSDLNRLVQSIWRDYVLNLDSNRQSTLVYQPLREMVESIKAHVGQKELWWSIFERYRSLFQQIRAGTLQQSDLILIIVPMALGLGLLYLLLRTGVLRFLSRMISRLNVEQRRRLSSIEFYVRMERLLSRFGIPRFPAETPLEYIQRGIPLLFQRLLSSPDNREITREFLETSSRRIVDSFYRIRYGDEPIPGEILAEIEKDLQTLEHVKIG